MLKRSLLLFGFLALILAGCTQAAQESVEEKLELKIKMTMLEPGKLPISVGMHNPTRREYAGNPDFMGKLTILDEAGNLLSEGTVNNFQKLAAGETFFPFTYTIDVVPGIYKVQFSALGKDPLEVDYEIIDRDGTLILSAPADVIDPFTLYVEAREVININN